MRAAETSITAHKLVQEDQTHWRVAVCYTQLPCESPKTHITLMDWSRKTVPAKRRENSSQKDRKATCI